MLANDLFEGDHGIEVKRAMTSGNPGATLIEVLMQIINVKSFLIRPVFLALRLLLRLLRLLFDYLALLL